MSSSKLLKIHLEDSDQGSVDFLASKDSMIPSEEGKLEDQVRVRSAIFSKNSRNFLEVDKQEDPEDREPSPVLRARTSLYP